MTTAALYPLGLRLDDWSLFDGALSPAAGLALLTGGHGPLFSADGARATCTVTGGATLLAAPDPTTATVQGPLLLETDEQDVAYAVTVPPWLLGEAGSLQALDVEIAALSSAGPRTADVAPVLVLGLGAADATTLVLVLGTPLQGAVAGTTYYATLHVTSTASTVAHLRLSPILCPPASSWATTP